VEPIRWIDDNGVVGVALVERRVLFESADSERSGRGDIE
jgi:hypothetical protein